MKNRIEIYKKNFFVITIIILCALLSGCSFFGIDIAKSEGSEVKGDILNTNEDVTVNDTKVTFKWYYLKTNTKKIETVNVEAGNVGLSKDEFMDKYKDWNLESFNKESVVLYKKIDSYPQGYYIITSMKENDEDYIVSYEFDENGNKKMIEKTQTPLELLDDNSKEEIKKGIVVKGKDEMYEVLQNYAE